MTQIVKPISITAFVLFVVMTFTVFCNDTSYGATANNTNILFLLSGALGANSNSLFAEEGTYKIIDTGQISCYDVENEITCPTTGEAFYGQDAQFDGVPFSFTDNGNGTVSDLNTGLLWQQVPTSTGYSWDEAVEYCNSLELAGSDEWRIPSLKELFSISDFSKGWPYIDLEYFDLASGSISKDEQFWSSNYYYVGTTHGGASSAFAVNHVTGHIKAYPSDVGGRFGNYVRCVNGSSYGNNNFIDNNDGTITDTETGLMWTQNDSGVLLDWENALLAAETLSLAGYTDWRLPSVKELQSIVDYSGLFPAIDTLFSCTPIVNEAGDDDYGYYWSNTSALFQENNLYYYAWYVAFGKAVDDAGEDTHGAGAVRFDTKVEGGPLGEGGGRYYNLIRYVREI